MTKTFNLSLLELSKTINNPKFKEVHKAFVEHAKQTMQTQTQRRTNMDIIKLEDPQPTIDLINTIAQTPYRNSTFDGTTMLFFLDTKGTITLNQGEYLLKNAKLRKLVAPECLRQAVRQTKANKNAFVAPQTPAQANTLLSVRELAEKEKAAVEAAKLFTKNKQDPMVQVKQQHIKDIEEILLGLLDIVREMKQGD